MPGSSKLQMAREGLKWFTILRRLLQPGTANQQDKALVKNDDNLNLRSLTYGFVETQVARVTIPLLIAEVVFIVLLVLCAISVVQAFSADHTGEGIFVIVLAVVLFGVWQLVRWVRHFIDRQVAKALQLFDRKVSEGQAAISDWPNWYRNWRNRKTAGK